MVRISRQFRLHGGTVGLDHGQGVTTLFIHLSKTLVKEGASVRPGQIIGHIGATGFATGPHLHWVVNVHGVSVNPAQWTPSIRPCTPRK
jgi:murein DD-endopeptidase MepM/ murein hydrolase activator NlpD